MKLRQIVFMIRAIYKKHLLTSNEAQDKFINIDVDYS